MIRVPAVAVRTVLALPVRSVAAQERTVLAALSVVMVRIAVPETNNVFPQGVAIRTIYAGRTMRCVVDSVNNVGDKQYVATRTSMGMNRPTGSGHVVIEIGMEQSRADQRARGVSAHVENIRAAPPTQAVRAAPKNSKACVARSAQEPMNVG